MKSKTFLPTLLLFIITACSSHTDVAIERTPSVPLSAIPPYATTTKEAAAPLPASGSGVVAAAKSGFPTADSPDLVGPPAFSPPANVEPFPNSPEQEAETYIDSEGNERFTPERQPPPINIRTIDDKYAIDQAGVLPPKALEMPDTLGDASPETILAVLRSLQQSEPNEALRHAEQLLLQYSLPYESVSVDSSGDILTARVKALIRSGALKQAAQLIERVPQSLRTPQMTRRALALRIIYQKGNANCDHIPYSAETDNSLTDEITLFCAAQETPPDKEKLERIGEAMTEEKEKNAHSLADLLIKGKKEQAKTQWVAMLSERYAAPDDVAPSIVPTITNMPEGLAQELQDMNVHAGAAEDIYEKLSAYRAAEETHMTEKENGAFLTYFVTRGLKLPRTLFSFYLTPSAESGKHNALAMTVLFYQLRKQRLENIPHDILSLTARALRNSGFTAEAEHFAEKLST